MPICVTNTVHLQQDTAGKGNGQVTSRHAEARQSMHPEGPNDQMVRLESISHTAYNGKMRVTLSIPDAIARKFRAAVPPRRRSRLVTRLIETELAKQEDALAAACRAANSDVALEREIDAWQAFDDGVEE